VSKRYPRAKWPLPIDVNPETSTCWRVPVPDDIYYGSAFRGALATLGSAVSWADDPGHTAVDVANVWREIADNLERCGAILIDVRQNEETPCILEKQIDGGDWEQFADLQLCPPKLRTNHGIIEWFDGASWIPLPGGNDERFTGTYDTPWPEGSVPEGQTAECLTAMNIVTQYDQNFTQMKTAFLAGQIASEVVDSIAGILAIFIPIEVALFEFLGIMTAFFAAGESAINDLTSVDTLTVLKCALNCNAGPDGSFDALEYEAVLEYCNDNLPDALTRTMVAFWITSLGPVGLSRMANASGVLEADCSDCGCGEWVKTWDFTVSMGDWYFENPLDPPFGEWISGTGIIATYNAPNKAAIIDIDFTGIDPFEITAYEIDYDKEAGYYPTTALDALSSLPWLTTESSAPSSTEKVPNWAGSQSGVAGLRVVCQCSTGSDSGSVTIRSVTIRGPYPNPFA